MVKKIKLPKVNLDCPMYRQIDYEILQLLQTIEEYNENMLWQFWRMNTKSGGE